VLEKDWYSLKAWV